MSQKQVFHTAFHPPSRSVFEGRFSFWLARFSLWLYHPALRTVPQMGFVDPLLHAFEMLGDARAGRSPTTDGPPPRRSAVVGRS